MNIRTPADTAKTRPTPAERKAAGQAQRKACERDWLSRAPTPGDDGRDPVAWLRASNRGRVPELVPLRHGRMRQDPFAFYRGAAGLMANDLAALPHSGVMTQLCGDAHLSNFGFFASPERALLFDVTDFDETLPGPFDWDLRRLATSFVIVARELGFRARTGSDAVGELTEAYRDHMRRFARMDTLEAWYWRLSSQTLLKLGSEDQGELALIRKARRNTARMFAKEATEKGAGDRLMIRDEPPFVYHDAKATRREIRRFREGLPAFMAQYRASLTPERRVLLDRYELHDVAVLTPGVGSVGRRVFLLLLVSDRRHPLFLQCKEASASVLETHLGGSTTAHPGQRIVDGQRLMQARHEGLVQARRVQPLRPARVCPGLRLRTGAWPCQGRRRVDALRIPRSLDEVRVLAGGVLAGLRRREPRRLAAAVPGGGERQAQGDRRSRRRRVSLCVSSRGRNVSDHLPT
jgi:uncharacterized protein (DUF2252 family)